MATTTNDLVTHSGKTFRLADLAHYMEDAEREEIHAGNDLDETPQSFWDRFVERFPESAQHLTEITPTTTPDYTEAEIEQAVADYATHHGVETDAVDVCRRYEDDCVIGFRLSLDVDGASRGCDERFGAWGE